MTAKAYLKYVEQGPDSLLGEKVRAALSFGDSEPEHARQIRTAHEREQREQQDRMPCSQNGLRVERMWRLSLGSIFA
jgi:hypothetical protein